MKKSCNNCANQKRDILFPYPPGTFAKCKESPDHEGKHLCHALEKTDPVTGPIPQTPRDCYKVREKYPAECPLYSPDIAWSM